MKAALYARFSTDLQRKESIEDQFRVAERLAQRHGFTVVARFSDAAISGGTTQRPGYQQLLAAVRRREIDVIVAEDTSRLWRNLAEQSPRLAELFDLGVAVVTQDLDTRHESAEIMGAVGGAMASAYRKEIGRRVRRGLEGLARNGKSAGGRAFGYVPAAECETKQIEIDQAQAEVVRRIFNMFADGHSPRAIAAALNRDRVPSPGAGWNRNARRKAGWMATAIYGNPARGLGILNNECYAGRVIWNRSRWIRSAADSSKRRQIQNPRKEWIVREDERLRIVSDVLWQRVKERQAARTGEVGNLIKRGLSANGAIRSGTGSKYLLSGLLRCSHCGAAYAIAGPNLYACGSHTSGGDALCSNNAMLKRHATEAAVVEGIKRDLRDPTVIEELCRRVRARLRTPKAKPIDSSARIATLQQQLDNLANAIASGALRASPTLATKLQAAEAELGQLQGAQAQPTAPKANVEQLLADLPKHASHAVERLEETLASGDVARGREELRSHVGTVSVEADDREIRLYGEREQREMKVLRAVGANSRIDGSGGRI